MIWLLLTIISVAGIFLIFKIIDNTNTPKINAIVINYFVASIIGFSANNDFPFKTIIQSEWIFPASAIGVLFILTFFLIAKSSQVVGIAITTVASKMSLILPMLFSIIMYNESITFIKIIAIIVALSAVFFSIYKKNDKTNISKIGIILPILLFIGMGIGDIGIVFAKEKYIDQNSSAIFTATLFALSFLSGFIILLLKPSNFKHFINYKSWLWGIVLGLTNFGSIYFMLLCLNSQIFDNSIIYGIVNISVVTISVLLGIIFFKERLTKINFIGIFLSLCAIIILSIA